MPTAAKDQTGTDARHETQTDAQDDRAPREPERGTLTLHALVEAALVAIDKALSPARLAEAVSTLGIEADAKAIAAAVEALNAGYERDGRGIRIEPTSGGFRMMTLPAAAGVVAAIAGARPSPKLSKAALETLAIIAYKQPITRADLEAIRGVACGEVLRSLLDRKLITITGRAEELGRPMLYGTTRAFLDAFGLASTKDLPSVAEPPSPPPASGPTSVEARPPASVAEPGGEASDEVEAEGGGAAPAQASREDDARVE